MIGHQLRVDNTSSKLQGPGLCPLLHNYSHKGNLRQDAGLVAMPELNRCHPENDRIPAITAVRELTELTSGGKSFCVHEDPSNVGYVVIEKNASEQQCAGYFHADSINQVRPLYVSAQKIAMCGSRQSCDAEPVHSLPS